MADVNTKSKGLWLNYHVTIPNTPASLTHSAEVPVESSYMAACHQEFYAALECDIWCMLGSQTEVLKTILLHLG